MSVKCSSLLSHEKNLSVVYLSPLCVHLCMYSLCSYTFPFNKMLDLETLRFNWICNHSHLSRNQKKSQRFNTEVKEILNTWEYQEISQVGTPDDCELGHFCDQKEISLLKKTSVRWFFKLCFWWLSKELFWGRVSLKCLFEKKKIISIDKGLQRLMLQLLKLMKQMFSHFLSWPNRIGSIALEIWSWSGR